MTMIWRAITLDFLFTLYFAPLKENKKQNSSGFCRQLQELGHIPLPVAEIRTVKD
jgi:hypothetical protein